jgi:hypothetical protein
MPGCSVELPQIIIIIFILIIVFIVVYRKKKECKDDESENNKTSDMYVPNCNMLTDKKICEQTKGCYYEKEGCRYDWTKLQ